MRKQYKTGGWSREFPNNGEGIDYSLKDAPRGLWRRFRARCRAEGVSVRVKLLRLVARAVEEPPAGADHPPEPTV